LLGNQVYADCVDLSALEYAQNDESRTFSGFAGKLPFPQNLDLPPLAPYTSAAPSMDVILNPRAALKRFSEVPGMEEDF